MKIFLENYLPRLFSDIDYLCIAHEGKQDLEKSIPRKLKAIKDSVFIVVRDNDSAECSIIKTRLQHLCGEAGHPDTLVRIVCQELESWYLGAPDVLADVYENPKLKDIGRKAKYRNPDTLGSPSLEILKLIPRFGKVDGARRIASVMSLQESDNSSHSFRVFISGLRRVVDLIRSENEGETGGD